MHAAGASYYLAATSSAIVWGILADKVGRRPTLLAGTLGTCCANLVFGFAPTYKVAIFGRYYNLRSHRSLLRKHVATIAATMCASGSHAMLL